MGHAVLRQGNNLVVPEGMTLPDVCLVTGQPTGGRVQSDNVQWIPPWTIIAFVLVRLIGIILMLVMRKTARFTYYWSEEAKKKRMTAIWIGVGLMVGSFVLPFAGLAVASNNDGLVVAFILLMVVGFLAGLIVAAAVAKPYQVRKIKDGHIHLGVKPAFWEGLQRAGIPVSHFGG